MTRNNLTEHLSWLLKSVDSDAAYSASTRALESVTLCEPSVGAVSTSSSCESAVLSARVSGEPRLSSFDADQELARPNLPASLLRAQSRDDMARLQSGPKSSHKPRLLSESTPAPLHTPTQSILRRSSNSLIAQYSQGLDGE